MALLKRKSNTQSLLILLFVIFLLMMGVYYYFFHTLKATGEEISTLSNQTDSLVNKESNLNSLHSIFSETSTDRTKLDSRFVQTDGAIDFITTIENLATFAHLSHQTVSVNTEDATPVSAAYELLHLNFKTDGSWQNSFYFLSLLETLPFNITINQINMHATGDTTNQPETIATLDFQATSSSSTIPAVKTTTKKSSVWDVTYDFVVVKLK